ncbi:MAG: PQQ-binding-like beta-propeller repeat protein, partial [bacterium]
KTLWTYKGESEGYLTPSLLRDTDGTLNILIAAYNSPEIVCLSPEGEQKWRYIGGAPINHAVGVGNINDDPHPEIVAAIPKEQILIALSADGILEWRVRLPGEPSTYHPQCHWTRPELADLNNDGRNEIVYADIHGLVTCLSGAGKTLWSKQISEKPCDRPISIGNVCRDGNPEILVGDEGGTFHCLSSAGAVIWEASLESEITARPVMESVEPDAPVSLFVATRSERLHKLTPGGDIEWSAELGGTMDLGSGIVLTDLDKDGKKEILASTRNHELIAFNASGKVLWRVETGAQIRSIPAIGDVDRDGEDEILIGSADWLLYCIDTHGNIEWTVKVGNRVDASPLLADLNSDGIQEIILPARGGAIRAFSAAP